MHANNSPRKKALLVGMRYADNDRMTSDSELICCTLEEFRDRLIRQYGYSDEDIKIPELTGSTSTNMSREFILRAAMDTLVTGAGVGDRFIFYCECNSGLSRFH
ncbi:hypothetical protein PHLCEN_2v8754 [Hermanssonia centrifuga]|uniref:Uncharacterized protein n=1 Tax=Hermanssonia centrifuga TaxID=98765 RepID=A0A2R6NSR7_9APHY|nr:hypothetical protein PHLCEN_2v8754 [Hermanssonia centrifuga]